MENERLIQDYFKNTLTDKELQAFNARLKADTAFKEEFELYRDINAALKKTEATKLKAHLKKLESQVETPLQKPASANKTWYSIIAAVLVVGLTITFYFNRTPDYYERYFESYPNVYQPIIRGQEASNYQQAFQAYENKDFSKAISSFKALEDLEENPNLQFYLAQSYLNLNKTVEAEVILEELSSSKFEFSTESKWYLVLVYLKQEKPEEALNLLKAMNEEKSDYKIAERTLILQKLDSP